MSLVLFHLVEKTPLTVIIPTSINDLDILDGALFSARFADEILMVDSSASALAKAKMKAKAEEYGANYLAHPYIYSAKQKNWAIPKARNKWVFILDSDEVITLKLRKTIQNLFSAGKIQKIRGFGIARKHFFFGKFLRFGGRYPLHNVRLFHKACRYEDRDVHAHIILKKNLVKNISWRNGDLLHFSDRSFAQFFRRFDRYSNYQANYLKKIAEKKVKIDWIQFFSNTYYFKAVAKDVWFFVPGAPLLRFLYMYVIKLGFLDGRSGLTIALLYALQDYVSKTKFYLLVNKNSESRVKVEYYFKDKLVGWIFPEKKSFSNKQAD